MIPALIGLRAAIDRAIEVLGPLEPVIAAWEAAQEAEESAACQTSIPRPTVGLFDPLPAVRRPTNGNSPSIDHCVACGAGITQAARGARRRYCGAACKAQAKAERTTRRGVTDELLPDRVERSFRT